MKYTIIGEGQPTETKAFMTLNDLLNPTKQYQHRLATSYHPEEFPITEMIYTLE